MILRTKRLKLRELRKSDAKDFFNGLNNFNISKWLILVSSPYTLADANEWISNAREKSRERPREDYFLGIELTSQSKIIGGMDLYNVDITQKTAEVGYWLGARYHNNGHGSEALQRILNFSFGRLRLRRLEASVLDGNHVSENLLTKFGFKLEGFKRRAILCEADKQIKNELIYGLLMEEYNII